MKRREAPVLKATIEGLRAQRCLVKKIHGNEFTSGLPDLYVLWCGNHCWVETKKPPSKPGLKDGGKLRPDQVIVFTEIVRAGGIIWVGDDSDWLVDRTMHCLRAANSRGWAELNGCWQPERHDR